MTQPTQTPATKKPRIAIMGEFSAGKSTLCNLLLRARPLPEKVTATRLPPVWMSKGPGQNRRMTLDGVEEPVDVENLDAIPFDDTRHIRLHFEAEILEHCDLIDFPGISDPNMDAEVWERVLGEADAVIWLTHATQAWRQTEAAVWDTVEIDVQEKSLLLVTRFDKLVTENDRKRVLARLRKETDGMFEEILPISLTEALDGLNDTTLWQSSGAEAFAAHLVSMIKTLSKAKGIEADVAPITPVAGAITSNPAPVPQPVAAAPTAPARSQAFAEQPVETLATRLAEVSAAPEIAYESAPDSIGGRQPKLTHNLTQEQRVAVTENIGGNPDAPEAAKPASVAPRRIKPQILPRRVRPNRDSSDRIA